MISSTPTLLRPNPSSLFSSTLILHGFGGWQSLTNIEAHSVSFFLSPFSPHSVLSLAWPLSFFFLLSLALLPKYVRQKQWGNVILHRKFQYIECEYSVWRASQPGEGGRAAAACPAFCLRTDWFTSHTQNPLNWTHSKTFTLARTLGLVSQFLLIYPFLLQEFLNKLYIIDPQRFGTSSSVSSNMSDGLRLFKGRDKNCKKPKETNKLEKSL